MGELVQFISEKTAAEYGPPSTHVVGISLVLYPHLNKFNLFYLSLIVSSISRVYLGAHTIFCIITGSLFSIILHIFHQELSIISNYNSTGFLIIHLIILLIVIFNFPKCSDDKILANKAVRDQQRISMASVALIIIDLLDFGSFPV